MPRQRVADERDLEDAGAGGHVGEQESPFLARHDPAGLTVEEHARVLERLTRPRNHDEATDRSGGALAGCGDSRTPAGEDREEAGPQDHRRRS
jgi:hypothetical protein